MAQTLLRFKDLAASGIVKNWPQLKNLVDKHGFPSGFMLSTNCRVWYSDEIDAWLKSRPLISAPLRGAAKRMHEAKARDAQGAA